MNVVYVLFLLTCAIPSAFGYQFNWRSGARTQPLSKQQSVRAHWTIPHQRAASFRLDAKPKISKFISEELLASLEKEHAEPHPVSEAVAPAVSTKKSKKSKSHKHKTDVTVSAVFDERRSSGATVREADAVESSTTVAPEVVRKKSPSSRIRFVESSQPDFVSIGLDRVGLRFGDAVVLKDATLSVSSGERVGLVGPNGGGKSTILKILSGELEPSEGTIVKSSANLRLAYLKQEFAESLVPTRTLRDELLSAFVEEQQILTDIAQCEEELAQTVTDTGRMDAVLARMQRLHDLADAKQCYALAARVDKVMGSMGFAPEDGRLLVGSFSGGWKMRIGLAKILLLDPNILLLDEPTNHMDLDSVIWLEDFLQRQSIPLLVVSHDREFLDRVCNKIVDMEDGATVAYSGNYSRYLAQRKARLAQWRDRYEKQQRYFKEEEAYIRKAHGDPSLAQVAKSRETALQKLKAGEDCVFPPPRDRKFRFRFPPAPRCGESVIECGGLGHGYGDGKYRTLFEGVDLQVRRGDRMGFVGPNGSGKSTLLRLLMKMEEPKRGFCDYCTNSVRANYYAQNQADALDLDLSVLETVQQHCPEDLSPTDLRALLSQFMFKGDDVYKPVRVLSGGEKARVALCKMMLQPANLLLLDEPTNHLDITAKEVLEDALLHYGGAVVLVSHDRYFMSQVANTICAFRHGVVERHDCDYHDYLEKLAEATRKEAGLAEGEETEPGPTEGENSAEGNDGAFRINDASVVTLKDKVTSRYVVGDKYRITPAKAVQVDPAEQGRKDHKRNFGGSGVTCGNPFKGIKNAKRFKSNYS